MEVHRTIGPGFLEAVYREAMAVECAFQRIELAREVPLPITYRGRTLSVVYRADLVCFGDIIVELKAIRRLGAGEDAQVMNYLKASRLSRALLFNFAAQSLEYRRFVSERYIER